MRIIALEEHYADHDILAVTGFNPGRLPPLRRTGLVDLPARLSNMDAAGIDVEVLSSLPPRPQRLTDDVDAARRINTALHAAISYCPHRFAAFATLPLNDPAAAATELDHAVTHLGLVGAMIYGMPDGRFLDHPSFSPVLDMACHLNVPLYLHPGFCPESVAKAYYSNLPAGVAEALSTHSYGWHYETSLHALRLITSGTLDTYPRLQVILGHLGEGLPFHLSRIDNMLAPAVTALARPVSRYLRNNFWFTTSGYFDDGPFALTRNVIGADRLLFAVDYPFADSLVATTWLRQINVNDVERQAIAAHNATGLLALA